VRSDLVVLVGVLALAFLSMGLYRLLHHGKATDPLESKARGTFVLGNFVRSWFYWAIAPAVSLALRAGLSPTFFNLAGAAFGVAAGAAFAVGMPVLGGWAVFLGGAADVFDGRIARSRGIDSPRGAFLDSTLDRFAEVGVFAGLAIYFHAMPVLAMTVALALGGSLLVSYTRARGESQGVTCTVGVMQRAERLLLIGFAGLLDPALTEWVGRPPGLLLALVIFVIALGTLATAIFRTVWIASRLPNSNRP
jgi:CDP-diacylglycerol--glycerol-3-phosphate 3-phosphatidyltransferase